MSKYTRRTLLRGAVYGSAVSVGLPLLDCFLNTNGTALAAGAPLPVRFGTWFWGLGVTPSRFFPTKEGKDYELLPETQPFAPSKNKVSIMTGFDAQLDGRPNFPHGVGSQVIRSGIAPTESSRFEGPTFDLMIADQLGRNSRFQTLDLSTMRGAVSNSARGAGQLSPSEDSPGAFYARLFGAEFVDPNSSNFRPSPLVMARHSVLSAVAEQRVALEREVGAADRARLDQYFTSLRRVENQLEMQLEPPPPMAGCRKPMDAPDFQPEVDIEAVAHNHRIMTELLAMALMCDQSRVFNLNFNNAQSSLTFPGSTVTHHQLTHEEGIDAKLGYQLQVTQFVMRIMQEWGYFLSYMDSQKEGEGTLLDHMLVVAHSETCFARAHTITSLPIMVAGRAGGRIDCGLNVLGKGSTVSRVALTVMQALGLSVDRWGTGGNEATKPLAEMLI